MVMYRYRNRRRDTILRQRLGMVFKRMIIIRTISVIIGLLLCVKRAKKKLNMQVLWKKSSCI